MAFPARPPDPCLPTRRRRLRRAALPAGLAAVGVACSDASGPAGDGGADAPPETEPPAAGSSVAIELIRVAGGLDRPLYLTAPPGDARIFVVEQPGRVREIGEGGASAAPFLDLTDRVLSGGERGMLGLAFDPEFATDGRFFVSYTALDGSSRIEAFRAPDGTGPVDPATGRTFLDLPQPFANHNGGHVVFGPDGMLYLALGDGGGAGDPSGNGQDRSTLLGSILRVDVSGRADPPYRIPEDNPFAGTSGARGEIWAYGLRNPWRFSFDRAADLLFIGDVGQNRWEEIDVVPASAGGRNFGWNVLEGFECFRASTCSTEGTTPPALVYDHGEGCSVTGGHVYRGRDVPALAGIYVYGDFCGGWIRGFRPATDGSVAGEVTIDLPPLGSVSSFGLDASGELYVTTLEGDVYRFGPGA